MAVTVSSRDVPLHENDVVAERFRLVRELGRGGMGSVWLAQHESLRIACAVKFISDEGTAVRELRVRFEQEARAAAQIRSPHVVGILDHGIWQNQPYIAMEYLEGEDLAARLAREHRISPRETAEIVTQVARGLVKAHALGVIHRDLKPENLFLVREDEGVTVKILDFGIAKSPALSTASDARTRTGTLLGTPYYMSPEQADGTLSVDHRSDLWSVAVIAFRCLTGQLPFESEAIGDLLMKIMQRPLPIPSVVAPDLPPGFDTWWLRAAARPVHERFQSARELADALSVALGIAPMMTRFGDTPTLLSPGVLRDDLESAAADAPAIDASVRARASATTFALTAKPAVPSARARRRLLFAAGFSLSLAVGAIALGHRTAPVRTAATGEPAGDAALPARGSSPASTSAPIASADVASAAAASNGFDRSAAAAAISSIERPPASAPSREKPRHKSSRSKDSGNDEPDLGF